MPNEDINHDKHFDFASTNMLEESGQINEMELRHGLASYSHPLRKIRATNFL